MIQNTNQKDKMKKKKSEIKILKQRIKILHNRLELMYKIGGLIVALIIVPLCALLAWKLSTNPPLYY